MKASSTYQNRRSDAQESVAYVPPRLITRFGDMVDVRNRGTLRIGRFAGTAASLQHAPAVVRLWHAEHCKEMSAHEAREFAGQLLAAAALADSQNNL